MFAQLRRDILAVLFIFLAGIVRLTLYLRNVNDAVEIDLGDIEG